MRRIHLRFASTIDDGEQTSQTTVIETDTRTHVAIRHRPEAHAPFYETMENCTSMYCTYILTSVGTYVPVLCYVCRALLSLDVTKLLPS
jgi:hypothetical protein